MNIPKPKRKRFYKKWWSWLMIVFLLLILAAGGAGYYGFTKIKGALPEVLEEYIVAKKDIVKTATLEGVVQSKKQGELYWPMAGQVTEVQVKIGETVSKDKLLAKIDADGLVTAKQQELKAPFDGLVTEVNISVDELVSPQILAIKVESLETEIKASASEQEITNLTEGLAAKINFDAYPQILLTGKVATVAERKETTPALTAGTAGESAGYEVKLNYDQPSDLQIKRDVSCEAEIVVGEKKEALAIPLAAVKWEEDESYVELKTENGSEKRTVELGFEGDEYVEVVAGLAEQDKLILFSAADIIDASGMF